MTKVLGIEINPVSRTEILSKVRSLRGRVVTLNPEFILYLRSLSIPEANNLLEKLTQTIDGYGLQCALIASDNAKSERITGLDIIDLVINEVPNAKTLIIGNNATRGLQKAKSELMKRGMISVDLLDPGKLDENTFLEMNTKIVQGDYDLVLIGLPMRWQMRSLTESDFNGLMVGVGGAFDMISGDIKRAPEFMRRVGLEWFWRFLREFFRDARHYKNEPPRYSRVLKAVIVFPLLVIFDSIKRRNILKSTYYVFRFLLQRG